MTFIVVGDPFIVSCFEKIRKKVLLKLQRSWHRTEKVPTNY